MLAAGGTYLDNLSTYVPDERRLSASLPLHSPISMSGTAPLALAHEAFAEQKGWRRNQELVDALPYVDGLQPAEKDAANALIEEEVGTASVRHIQHAHHRNSFS